MSRIGRTGTGRVSMAPGRVNLMGDHIDYHGMPVLPMAIDRSVRITFRPLTEPRLVLRSSADARVPLDRRFDEFGTTGPSGDWRAYPEAAARGLIEYLGGSEPGTLLGLEGEVESDVPIAAGLSSSSALVVATALALLDRNRIQVPPRTLMELLARSERFVGTRGGGMDQAVSLGAREGHAVRIDFDPIRLRHVRVPEDWAFVIAHSGRRAHKSGAERTDYNDRAGASQAAAETAAAALGDAGCALRELVRRHGSLAVIDAGFAGGGVAGRRLRHVVTESARVEGAAEALVAGDRERFGAFMTASHASLRDDCEVSTEGLDALAEAAVAAGADGARLTGAGFGGCIVALSARSSVERLVDALVSVAPLIGPGAPFRPFVAEPSDGAGVSGG